MLVAALKKRSPRIDWKLSASPLRHRIFPWQSTLFRRGTFGIKKRVANACGGANSPDISMGNDAQNERQWHSGKNRMLHTRAIASSGAKGYLGQPKKLIELGGLP